MRQLFHREAGSTGDMRLDAAESAFVKRELEYVDKETYKQLYASLIMRSLLPIKSDIPVWAQVHTWREMDMVGKARIITSMGDDLPRTDVFKREVTKTIKTVGGAYGYSWDEMQASAAMGTHLDTDRAFANRFDLESEADKILAYGNAQFGLEGLFTLSGTTAFTLSDKAKGGKTWGTIAAPNATGMEVAADLMGFAAAAVEASIGKIAQVDIVLTIEAYNYAAQKPLSSTDSTKALAFALSSPFIRSITPCWRAKASLSDGALANDTMLAYPNDPMVLAGVMPLEYSPQPAQQVNLEWKINTILKCGGAVSRYPYLIFKATGFGA